MRVRTVDFSYTSTETEVTRMTARLGSLEGSRRVPPSSSGNPRNCSHRISLCDYVGPKWTMSRPGRPRPDRTGYRLFSLLLSCLPRSLTPVRSRVTVYCFHIVSSFLCVGSTSSVLLSVLTLSIRGCGQTRTRGRGWIR